MYSRVTCFTLAFACALSVVAEERGKKFNTAKISYCLSNGSQKECKLVMFYGKQKGRKLTDVKIEQRQLATAGSKKTTLGSTAVTFTLVAGPLGKDLVFEVYDMNNVKLGSKGLFVNSNVAAPSSPTGEDIDEKDERLNIIVNSDNSVQFNIGHKP